MVVQNDPVFDAAEARFWPWRLANALHVETREYVIRRELLFDVGDPVDEALVAESERNLRALGVFRDVVILGQDTDSGVVMIVRTADAWTTTLGMGVATSGTQSVIDLSLQEGNLLGTRTLALLAYRNDTDRSSIALAFDTPRAIGDRIGIGASMVDRSDGRAGTGSLRLPFLSLSSRVGASLSASVFQGRVLQFANGSITDSLWRESALLRADAAHAVVAGPRGFVRVGLMGQWLREDLVALEDRASIPRSRTAVLGPYVTARAPRYIRVRNVERMERIEDIDLGLSANAALLAAPSAWGYGRDGIGASLGAGIGFRIPLGFVRLGASGAVLQTREGTDSASALAAGTIIAQPGDGHLVVLHASGGTQRNVVPGREFDLGLGAGLRAWPAHAFTGDRYYVVAAEYRVLVLPRLFDVVGVGAAAFVGQGGAWNDGDPVRAGTEAGLGLRIASLREAGPIWRLDLSRRVAGNGYTGGWVVSLGRGFVFGRI